MKAKIWIRNWLFSVVLIFILVGTFNYTMDPMWIFNHKLSLNSMQEPFDERKLKTIYLLNHKNHYNTLLIGSSRTAYYNQNEFQKDMNVFNYAFAGGSPFEYHDFINLYKKHNTLDNLIIGLDFMNVVTSISYQRIKENKEMIAYISNSSNIMLYLENYFSIDILKYSVINLKRFITNKTDHRSYDRNNIAKVDRINQDEVIRIAYNTAKKYYLHTKYNLDFLNSIKKIKADNTMNIAIFTTPLSEPFLNNIMNDENLKQAYFQWIKDMVEVFGEIYFTTYKNDFSINYPKYARDGNHYYPFIGKIITQYVSAGIYHKTKEINKNIIVINRTNLQNKINEIKNMKI